MNKYVCWIWLRLALKSDVKMMYALWKTAGSILTIFQAQRELLEHWGVPLHLQAALLDKDVNKAYNIFGICEQFDLQMVCIEDDEYPQRLLDLAVPPCLLFYQGDLYGCLSHPSLTMVGTRSSTATGEALAAEFAHHLSVAGFTLFCGVAEGIENEVHRATVDADGRCVLLLPSGLLTVNRRLSFLIAKVLPQGAVVSECLPNEKGGYDAYQVRNRLFPAFTLATVILQAPHKSGAMMTASYTLEQNKEVFVLPGGLRDPSFAGNNELLRDGATPIIEPADIVQYFLPKYKDELQEVVVQDDAFEEFIGSVTEGVHFENEEEKLLFSLISKEKIAADELSELSGIPPHRLLPILTIMEIKGWIAPLPGGKYKTVV